MTSLPLWPAGLPEAAVESAAPRNVPDSCERCALTRGPHERPTRPVGDPGGLLVVGPNPTKDEAVDGRPFFSAAGTLARRTVQSYWKGPVVFDLALRCPGGNGRGKSNTALPKNVEACRPHLAAVVQEARPRRILLLGSEAYLSVLGRTAPPMSVRRGYSFLSDGTPAFLGFWPSGAARNPLIRASFESDVRWALTTPDPSPSHAASVQRPVDTVEDAAEAVRDLSLAPWASFDVETVGRQHDRDFRVISLAASRRGTNAAWTWDRAALEDHGRLAPLLAWLADPHAHKVGQNVKYDCLSAWCAWGVEVKGVVGDTRLWRKLMDGEAAADLGALSELVGAGGYKGEMAGHLRAAHKRLEEAASAIAGKKVRLLSSDTVKGLHGEVDAATLSTYNARDAVVTARVAERLEAQLAEDPVSRVWDLLLQPASRAVERMERTGIGFDVPRAEALRDHLRARLVAASLTFDGAFNPDSPKQVAEFLYDKHHLPILAVTAGRSPSTSAEVIEQLVERGYADRVPELKALLDWRRVKKVLGTYAEGLLEHVRADGRIHPSFNLDGARSGRLSCSDPNLQNIPARDEELAKLVRDCFVAEPGWKLVEVDFSQLELRIAAMLSGDAAMIDAFRSGEDFHLLTAKMVSQVAWGIAPDAVGSAHRRMAKTVNFGLAYGQGDAALAAQLGITLRQAQAIREAILGRFRDFARWTKERVQESTRTGTCWTWWDGRRFRRRPLPDIASSDDKARSVASHGAYNTPIQGTGSDYCLFSLVEVDRWVQQRTDRVRLVLSVHDSIMLEARDDVVDEAAAKVVSIMEGWPAEAARSLGPVPIVAEAKVGQTWGEMSAWRGKVAA